MKIRVNDFYLLPEEEHSNILARANVTINDRITIKGIKLFSGSNGPCVMMPSYKSLQNGKEKWVDHVYCKDTLLRDELLESLKRAYADAIKIEQMPDQHVAVKLTRLDRSDSMLKAIGYIEVDGLIIRNIRVLQGKHGQLFVSMPQYQKDGIWQDLVYPCTQRERENIKKAILKEYEEMEVQKKWNEG